MASSSPVSTNLESSGLIMNGPSPPTRDVARPVSNLGNTCYINCVLQALAHAPELCMALDCEPHHVSCPIALENRKRRIASGSPTSSPEDAATAAMITENDLRRRPARKLRRSNRKSPTNGVSANGNGSESGASPGATQDRFCALCEMEWHLQEVHSENDKDKAVAPSHFVHGFIDHVAPWFKLGQQEDSHEFLRLLIDAMQRSCKDARPKSEDEAEEDIPPIEEPEPSEPVVNKDTEYPFQLFRGMVESCVTCDSCKASSSTFDPIEDVGLEVTEAPPPSGLSTRGSTPPTNEALADIASAFSRFAKKEALDSGYKCEKCGKVGRATKESRLASIPPILTLHLKRFRYGGDVRGPAPGGMLANRRTKSGSAKIEGHIKFEHVLDLRPYMTNDLQKKVTKAFCRLFAVIVHAGKNSHSGHYIAYVRSVNKNEWWKMDDARVTQAHPDEVKSAEAYMLFYRVVDHPFTVYLGEKAKQMDDDRKAYAAKLAAAEEEGEKTEETAAAQENPAMESSEIGEHCPEEDEKENMPAPEKNVVEVEKPPDMVSTKNMDDVQSNDFPKASGNKPGQKAQPPTPTTSAINRKRNFPEYPDGKSWAKANTRLKASNLVGIKSAEEYISENIEFKPEFFKRINDEGMKANAKLDSCPITHVTSGDVVGGYAKFSLGLKKTVHRIATRFEQETGESFFRLVAATPLNDAANSNLVEALVTVGNATRDDDLL